MTRRRFSLPFLASFAVCIASLQGLAQEPKGAAGPETKPTPTRFRILDATGTPVIGATVRLIHQTQTFRELVEFKVLHETRTDEDAYFQLPPGYQVANAQTENEGFSATWVTVPGNEHVPERTWLLGTSAGAFPPYMEMIYAMVEGPEALRDLATDTGEAPKIPTTYTLPNCETTVRVVNDDGSPAGGVAVTPIQIVWLSRGIGRHRIFVPPQLHQSLSRKTDADGKVTFTTIAKAEFTELEFESVRHGRQRTFSNSNSIEDVLDKDLMLFPTGSVQGTIHATSDSQREFLAGRKLLFKSQIQNSGIRVLKGRPISMHGVAEVTVDKMGRFEIPKMMTGRMTLYDRLEDDAAIRITFPDRYTVKPGETANVTGSVISTVLVRGIVLKRDLGLPVPSVAVAIHHGKQSGLSRELTVYATTDEVGGFEARVFPGMIGYSPMSVIKGYVTVYRWEQPPRVGNQYMTLPSGQRVTIPSDVDEWTLPPIEVVPAITLTGRLLDAQGKPVVGVGVYGFPMANRTNCGYAQTNTDGKFTMEGVPSTHPPRFFKAGPQNKTVAVAIDSEEPLVLKMPN